MSTNNTYKSELFRIHNITQNTMIRFPKEAIINVLRKFYAQNSLYYRYVEDEFGFPQIPSQKDLELLAGITDDDSSRIYIGEFYHQNTIFYPCILIKNNGATSVPLSASQEEGTIWETVVFDDGAGHKKNVNVPKYYKYAGMWEGSISVNIYARSIQSRDELVELTAMCLQTIYWKELQDMGVVVKPVKVSGPSEQEDRNSKIFTQAITIDYFSNWERMIPITNVIERIVFTIDVYNTTDPNANPIPDPNFQVKSVIDLADVIIP